MTNNVRHCKLQNVTFVIVALFSVLSLFKRTEDCDICDCLHERHLNKVILFYEQIFYKLI